MVKYTEKDLEQIEEYKDRYAAQELILKSQQKAVVKTENELHDLATIITDLSRITEFYEGTAINILPRDTIYGKGGHITINSVPETGRSADVYINAHHPELNLWGCRLTGQSLGSYGGKFLGARFTKDEALRLAKEWIVNGKQQE